MRTICSARSTAFRRCLLLLLFLAAVLPARSVVVDLNADGVSDIWALKYGVTTFSPTADTDGDGIPDAAEAIAGTDPFSANSTIKITGMVLDASGLHLTFSTQPGKGYLVQKTVLLSPPGWVTANPLTGGAGGDLTVTLPAAGATGFFYRVVVQDMDSDGDGVNDWEEIQLGFDPKSTHSNGLSAVDDLTAITQALQATNTVSISAVTPNASEAGLAPGVFVVTRTGNLNPITVNYAVAGTATAGSDYTALSGSVVLPLGAKNASIMVTPKADNLVESPETVIVTLGASAAYTVGSPNTATVLISDDVGATAGTGLMGQFWEENALGSTLGQNVQPAFAGTTTTPVLFAGLNLNTTYTASGGPLPPSAFGSDGYWSSRWTGEVLPAYSQIYTFYLETNFAGRLYVGGQLVVNNWPPATVLKSSTGSSASGSNQVSGTIELQNNVRYPIVVEHYQDGGSGRCYMFWSSANEPKNYIPATRLFPTTPPQITSAKDLLLLKGSGAFSYQITASANPTGYGVANLPAGWSFNSGTGVISGSPTVAGTWPIVITATNAQGSGSAILNLTVIDTGGGITRDVWSGSFADVATLPLTTAPASTGLVGALEGPLAPGGGDYGARLRGYMTAPTTGVYQFWLAASDNAELWISDDDEPINLFQRAATTGATTYRGWAGATAGKSPLLYLKAGLRYYVEVRHADIGADGHVSVGWLKPGQSGTVPGEVVPGYALSPYAAPTVVAGQSTLFAASLTSQGAAVSGGSGFATLQLSADEKEAILYRSYTNLTSTLTGEHIHDGTLPTTSNIIFDLDAATPQQDGSYVWKIVDVPGIGRTAAQFVQELKAGQLYLNLHTANYPSGEIKGYFSLQAASQTFTAPAAQTWTDPASATDTSSVKNANGASRFLTQATFGPTGADITALQASDFEAWIVDQFTKSATHHRDYVEANKNTTNPNSPTYYTDLSINSWWKNSITAPDQLRQRLAFALSEILVISSSGALDDQSHGLTAYYDTLLDICFGRFDNLLKAVTLTPTMGVYLDMRRNDKPNLASGLHPNENYAREIQQLFSIGLNRMFPDGTLMLNSKGQIIPTYDQDVITGFAHAFTGWNYNQPNAGGFLPTNWYPGYDIVNPMKEVPSHHFTGQKRILDNVVLPGLPTLPSLGNQVLDPYAGHTDPQIQTPEYQALPAQELTATHDALFKHPNTGPFLCKQLIQRFVTSTPSRGYVYRVVRAFNGESTIHGVATGVRGDMQEVMKAILLDYEARSNVPMAQQGYGKQREPALRVTATARAFRPQAALSGPFTQDGGVITVNTSPTAHRLASGNAVSLDFTSPGTPATSGNYSLSGSFPPTTTVFSVRTKDIIRSNYTQSGNTVTVATGNNGGTTHGLTTGDSVYLRFRDGAGKPADGVFPVTVTDSSHFTVPVLTSATLAISNCDVAFLTGEYVQSGTTVTFTCATVHGLTSGTVAATFVVTTGQTTVPTLVAPGTITVVDATHFSITATDSVSRSGTFVAAPSAPLLDRTGTAATNFENWIIGGTDTDLAQTPMRSPTVFNFFVPDYQFPGSLAAAGLYTPEFQLTSDTNVMRQANYLFGGVFAASNSISSGNTNGISSFKNGGGAITLDFLPWMGNGPGSVPWTNDVNLNALIDQLSTLLLAGHLDNTGTNTYTPARVIVNAQQAIYDYVRNTANISYNNTTPSDTNKRDRIRAIVHLLVTSPDFTIQK